MRRRPNLWGLALMLGGPALMLTAWFLVPIGVFGPGHPAISWTAFALALVALAGALLHEIWAELTERPGHPAFVIVMLIAAALIVFATSYQSLARTPGAFNGALNTRLDAMYFTVITMATVGYGDITPVSQEARGVVMLQILYTLIFLTAGATSVSRRTRNLVGRRLGQQPPEGRRD
ncbi:potassium channel family protein [Kitasatospora sp. NPDC051914]|uniref:potassium channel family protein n=1 Tax=Kitasatospora sp. NPDC051914 TaxID=3154945 RepID=UPI00342E18F0